MKIDHVVPILNVSDVAASIAWFRQLGWKTSFTWDGDDPDAGPTFGGVCAGDFEIFLCRDGQGGRGEHAAWVSIWVDDPDALFERCVALGLDVTLPPTDEPWGVREMHLRHPDGHVFRVSREVLR